MYSISEHVSAIPAKPLPITITTSNGIELTVKLYGNENFSYMTTLDGYLIQRGIDGSCFYIDLGQNNEPVISQVLVHDIEKRTTTESEFLQTLNKDQIIEIYIQKTKNTLRSTLEEKPELRIGKFPTTGDCKSLVILVEFQDVSFSISQPNQAFNNLLNQEGYSKNGATGSCRDYFIANSLGRFTPQFDIYGPVRVSKRLDYYGAPDGSRNDTAPDEMVVEACQILHNQGVDFSEYDIDQDGLVDNVYVFYAGYGQADGGSPVTIWPHTSTVASHQLILNGVQVNTYACSSELINGTGKTMCGIGTFAHEFCHVLGIPDLYDTRSSGRCFTPGKWSLIDSGGYNNEQRTPPNLTAYERFFLNWLDPVELNSPANLSLLTVDNNTGYIIKTGSDNEYFILENRQQRGWDIDIPGHGMLIWHIDYDEELWSTNRVNIDPDHQHIDIEEADGSQSIWSRDGDAFPGASSVRSFTDHTNPGMKTWSGNSLGKPITNIIEEDGIIYFQLMGGKAIEGTPTALQPGDIGQDYFTAKWEPHPGATNYLIYLYTETESGNIEYIENYNGFKTGNQTSYTIPEIEPGIEYFYKIKAIDPYSETGYSNEIMVKTLDPTFEYFKPIANEARNIQKNSFTASWNALQDAVSYTINIYKKNYSAVEGIAQVDFTGRIAGIPEGWKTNCSSTFSSDGYYGKEAPSLRLDTEGQYIQSPVFEKNISNLSFWYRGYNSAENNSVVIRGQKNDKWVKIQEIKPIVNENGGIITLKGEKLDGCNAVSITFNRQGAGGLAIDDINLEYGSVLSIDSLDNYKELDVHDNLSLEIEGLDPATTYFYTVKAYNGSVWSRTSDEVEMITSNLTGISQETYSPKAEIVVIGNTIYIKSNSLHIETIDIFNTAGHLIYSGKVDGELYLSKSKLMNGVHIIKIGQQTNKIIF